MNTMAARQELIASLFNRGFKAGPLETTGWTYIHAENDSVVWFNSQGGFKIDLPNGKRFMGVAVNPADILSIIDGGYCEN